MLFIEFPAFTKAITKLPDDDYAIFQSDLAADPEQGDLIRGSGGFRKARMGFPSVGIGTSGGARAIYLYLADLQITLLVILYAKAKKTTISDAQTNDLRKLSAEIRSTLGSRKS